MGNRKNVILAAVAGVLLVAAVLLLFRDSIFGSRPEPSGANLEQAAKVNAEAAAGTPVEPPNPNPPPPGSRRVPKTMGR